MVCAAASGGGGGGVCGGSIGIGDRRSGSARTHDFDLIWFWLESNTKDFVTPVPVSISTSPSAWPTPFVCHLSVGHQTQWA